MKAIIRKMHECTTSMKCCFEMKSVIRADAGKCHESHEYTYCQECMGT